MIVKVPFPFGVANARQVNVPDLMGYAEAAVRMVRQRQAGELAVLLEQKLNIPKIHHADAVRQLALGFGLASPDQVNFAEVDVFAKSIEEGKKEDPHDPRAVRILAKSLYRELRGSEFSAQDIMALSGELLALVTADVRAIKDSER